MSNVFALVTVQETTVVTLQFGLSAVCFTLQGKTQSHTNLQVQGDEQQDISIECH